MVEWPCSGNVTAFGLLFLLGAGCVGGGSRAELIWSECRRAVHSLQLHWWSPNIKQGHGDGQLSLGNLVPGIFNMCYLVGISHFS